MLAPTLPTSTSARASEKNYFEKEQHTRTTYTKTSQSFKRAMNDHLSSFNKREEWEELGKVLYKDSSS